MAATAMRLVNAIPFRGRLADGAAQLARYAEYLAPARIRLICTDVTLMVDTVTRRAVAWPEQIFGYLGGVIYTLRVDKRELRELSRSHRIYSVPEAVERLRRAEVVNLSPLCRELPRELAWPYLRRVVEVVMAEATK